MIIAVGSARSYRAVLVALGLVPAGGNYAQVQKRILELGLDTSHFLGAGWNKGGTSPRKPVELSLILTQNSDFQSHKLKKRLFLAGLKQPKCELCGWAEMSEDGRVPVELDHINGNHRDNRLHNLRILCPNCHSLQATHRGRNKKTRIRADVVTGSRATLKMSWPKGRAGSIPAPRTRT